jgi:RNA ligase (TIGR02306 family)
MERKLASIQKIKEIRPIKDADSIELCIVNGWQCVAKKGVFKKNDLCIYMEIDSFLPIENKYDFLRSSSFKEIKKPDGSVIESGFRLRTIKLRGQISQGLVMPISDFSDIFFEKISETYKLIVNSETGKNISIGDDVTSLLNITKYDPPLPAQLAGQVKGNFPNFIKKTDQERIQNIFDELKLTDNDTEWEVSIKLDGTSCTYFIIDPDDLDKFDCKIDLDNPIEIEESNRFGYVGHCSRNLETKDSDSTPWKIGKPILDSLQAEYFGSFAIQGELIGSGIQKNNECLKTQEFYCFDIWDINEQCYMSKKSRDKICDSGTTLIVKQAPILGIHKLSEFDTIDDILAFADGPSLNPDSKREGLVFKSLDGKKSFKVISNKWLLKNG